MAVVTAKNQLTLAELAKRHDPKGETASIVESLTADNEIMQDISYMEANDRTSHLMVRRVSQPSGSWRKLNSGVAKETSKTQEVRETVGMLESYSEIDKALVDMATDPNAFRNGENKSFLEGMSQTIATAIFYSSVSANPEKFDGFNVRMGSLAATANVVGQGGTGSDLTSIYMINFAPGKVYGIYPKGHKTMGIEHRDLGEETSIDASSLMHQVVRDWFGIKMGLAVQDDRCIGRLANIESTGASNTFDEDNLITILNRMPKSGAGVKLYVNDTIQTQMEIKLKDKNNIYYTASNGEGLAGERMLRFRGNPIRKCDAITITEAALT
jgi:hypothetical protein